MMWDTFDYPFHQDNQAPIWEMLNGIKSLIVQCCFSQVFVSFSCTTLEKMNCSDVMQFYFHMNAENLKRLDAGSFYLHINRKDSVPLMFFIFFLEA